MGKKILLIILLFSFIFIPSVRAVNMTVNVTPLSVLITSPLNTTYSTKRIWFNATTSGVGEWCGVSIDSEENITMNTLTNVTWFKFIEIDEEEVTHSTVAYCNDTLGTSAISPVVYFTYKAPPYKPFNDILGNIGSGTGFFLEAIKTPIMSFLLALGFIAVVLLLFYWIADVLKTNFEKTAKEGM